MKKDEKSWWNDSSMKITVQWKGQNVLLNNQLSTKPSSRWNWLSANQQDPQSAKFWHRLTDQMKIRSPFPFMRSNERINWFVRNFAQARACEQSKEGKEPDLISDALLVKDKGGKKDINRNVGRWCNNINSSFNFTRLSKTTFSLNSPLTQLQEFQELE